MPDLVAVWAEATIAVVIVKLALVGPPGMVSAPDGTRAFELLDESAIGTPLVGLAPRAHTGGPEGARARSVQGPEPCVFGSAAISSRSPLRT